MTRQTLVSRHTRNDGLYSFWTGMAARFAPWHCTAGDIAQLRHFRRDATLGNFCTTLAALWRAAGDGRQGVFAYQSHGVVKKNNAVAARVQLTTDCRALYRDSLAVYRAAFMTNGHAIGCKNTPRRNLARVMQRLLNQGEGEGKATPHRVDMKIK